MDRNPVRRNRSARARAAAVLVLAGALAASCTSTRELASVDYVPRPGNDWPVSTPEAQGLDSSLVAALYGRAAGLETIHALLLVKDGHLIGEAYFNGGSVEEEARLQSVTKSFTSALAGIAFERGCLTSLDQKMVDFFPELAGRIQDPRKRQITIEQMLQMRAGFPWEESTRELFDLLYRGFRPATLLEVRLVRDPGTGMEYSNLTSHLLGIVVARACSTDLRTFGQRYLFGPIGVEPGKWIRDWEGNYNGHADLYMTARDAARFGLLYADRGAWKGRQIVPRAWVERSLRTYSEHAWKIPIGRNFADMGYGYQWWSARAGRHRFHFAWGHGGQQIALVDGFDLVIVVTADPLFGQHGGGPWKYEKANLNLVGDFIASLPDEDRGPPDDGF
jgi:CubicO group peptidase (beta-lactamase class C family)